MAKYAKTEVVTAGAMSYVINHGLGSINAVLKCATSEWPWIPVISVITKTANSITVNFTQPARVGGSRLDVQVIV